MTVSRLRSNPSPAFAYNTAALSPNYLAAN